MSDTMKIFITYEQYGRLAHRLVKKVQESGITFDYIYGPPRGGLPIAVHFSHWFNKELISLGKCWELRATCPEKILLIDDIADTGFTLDYIVRKDKIIKTAVLIYKKDRCCLTPNFFVATTDKWVVFPWERPDEIPNREGY